MGEGIGRGREAFNRQAWRRAYDELSAAAAVEPLEVDDLERSGVVGVVGEVGEVRERRRTER